MAVRKVKQPTYNRQVSNIVKYYTQARELILREILREVQTTGNQIKINNQASLLRQIDYILSQMNNEVQQTLEEMLLAEFKQGQAVLAYSVGEYDSLSAATEGVAFTQLARETVDVIVADTFSDLLAATNLTSQRTKRVVRRVVQEQMKNAMLQQQGRQVMKKGIVDELLSKENFSKSIKDEGFVGIVDKKGRKWELNRYVDMVVRTKFKQARTEGMRIQQTENGYDLAVVSSHGAKDACRKYEGMVISMNGTTKGYPTYKELKASNEIFHPNCTHTVYPIRSEDLLSDEERETSRKKIAEYKK